MEILDNIEEAIPPAKNLRKSIILCKICTGLLVFSIFTLFILKSVNEDLGNLLMGLPMIAIIFISPFGFTFGLISVIKKEGSLKLRINYFVGNTVFFIIALALIWSLISDLSVILN
ncbi:MAG: hypothetical protein ACK40G_12850 [Cytophagaceae bacterium]